MLRTVQCRPAAACARKSPLRVHSNTLKEENKGREEAPAADEGARQDKTREKVSTQ
jgi:hypothetical protein